MIKYGIRGKAFNDQYYDFHDGRWVQKFPIITSFKSKLIKALKMTKWLNNIQKPIDFFVCHLTAYLSILLEKFTHIQYLVNDIILQPLFISRQCKLGRKNSIHPVSAAEMEEGDDKNWVVENSRMENQNDGVLLRNQNIMQTTEYNKNTCELLVNRNIVKLEPIAKSRKKKRKKKKKNKIMEERNDGAVSGDGEKQ